MASVRVKLFASYADIVGAPYLDVSIGESATVADIWVAIENLPGASRLPHRPMVAVNLEYADADTPVAASDDVALIPPVAGG